MTSTVRSLLLTMLFYFSALGAVAAGLYASLSVMAPAVQAHFLRSGERPQSRLDLLVADARAVRQALATPIQPAEPLPPITARPLRPPVAAKSEHERKVSSRRLNNEARTAYAMWERTGAGATTVSEDRYRPQ
jgi:hypothetical protein